MEHNEPTAKSWSRTQVCGLAVVFLVLGISIWCLAHAPRKTSAVISGEERPAVDRAADAKIMIDSLKQGADTQAEPLLARLRKSPDDPILLAEIGKYYYRVRQFPVAARYYKDSARLKPDAAVLVKLGGAYHFAGDDDGAIGAWNDALRLDPANPDALFNIGFVEWHSRGNPKAAIAALQKLLETNPDHPKRTQVEALLAQVKRHLEVPIAGNE